MCAKKHLEFMGATMMFHLSRDETKFASRPWSLSRPRRLEGRGFQLKQCLVSWASKSCFDKCRDLLDGVRSDPGLG